MCARLIDAREHSRVNRNTATQPIFWLREAARRVVGVVFVLHELSPSFELKPSTGRGARDRRTLPPRPGAQSPPGITPRSVLRRVHELYRVCAARSRPAWKSGIDPVQFTNGCDHCQSLGGLKPSPLGDG